MGRGCEFCARGGKAVEATFSRNIGMLIMRRSETVSGRHCLRCLSKNFATMQGLNMILGWWGYISFVMTLFYTASNVFHFTVGLGEIALGAAGEAANEAAVARARESVDAGAALGRFRNTIRQRLLRGEPRDRIAHDMVDAADVPLRKAEAYVDEIARELARSPSGARPG